MTHQLDTSCFMGYLSALCLSQPQFASGGSSQAVFRKLNPLSDQDLLDIKRSLKNLSPLLTFDHGDIPAPVARGICAITSQSAPPGTFPGACIGKGSIVRISTEGYHYIINKYVQYKRDPTSTEVYVASSATSSV
jgi:hypothetical protein